MTKYTKDMDNAKHSPIIHYHIHIPNPAGVLQKTSYKYTLIGGYSHAFVICLHHGHIIYIICPYNIYYMYMPTLMPYELVAHFKCTIYKCENRFKGCSLIVSRCHNKVTFLYLYWIAKPHWKHVINHYTTISPWCTGGAGPSFWFHWDQTCLL